MNIKLNLLHDQNQGKLFFFCGGSTINWYILKYLILKYCSVHIHTVVYTFAFTTLIVQQCFQMYRCSPNLISVSWLKTLRLNTKGLKTLYHSLVLVVFLIQYTHLQTGLYISNYC